MMKKQTKTCEECRIALTPKKYEYPSIGLVASCDTCPKCKQEYNRRTYN